MLTEFNLIKTILTGSPFQCSVTSHEYHAHVHPASNLSGQVPNVTTSHISHKTHIPAPPPSPPYPPLSAQVSYSPASPELQHLQTKSREVRAVARSVLQSERQLVRGNTDWTSDWPGHSRSLPLSLFLF